MGQKPELVLASYVTYKELYSCKKYRSPYQILAEFVKYIIYEKKLYTFSLPEMKKEMNETFGFKLPSAVMKTTLKKMECLECQQGKTEYSVNYVNLKRDSNFETYRNTAEKENLEVIEQLIEYVEKRMNSILNEEEESVLSEEFMAYLLDTSNGGRYKDAISGFLIKNERETSLTEQIRSIREGCILYTGVNCSIDEIGSLTDELVLYLDTEVLFDLYGYNGEVYQSLALDMMSLIREANQKRKYISLRYFRETKREIEDFFRKAEDIVLEKAILRESDAMKAITDGCKNTTDVAEKQSDFFYTLQYSYNIIQEEEQDYYTREQYSANLEGIVLEVENSSQEDVEQSLRFVSNINKLRKNSRCYDYFKSRYLFVTKTGRTLEISKRVISKIQQEYQDEEKEFAGYAITVSFLTNILWYKLNKGFGCNEYPKNIDAVLKAKIVLSNYISQNIVHTYDKCKEEFESGKISAEQFAARYLMLKSKNTKPEKINIDSIEDDLSFTPENIKKFEEESNWQKVQLQEKERLIEVLQNDASETKKKIDIMQKALEEQKYTQEILLREKNDAIAEKNRIIKDFQREREAEKHREEQKNMRKRFVIRLTIRLLVLTFIVLLLCFISKLINKEVLSRISTVVAIIGTILSFIDEGRRLYKSN